MKAIKNSTIMIIAAAVIAVMGMCAISFAAWKVSDAAQVFAVGSTGEVSFVDGMTVVTEDKTGEADGVIQMVELYPVDSSGDGLKRWKFTLSADAVGDTSVIYSIDGALKSSDGNKISDAVALLYWSFLEPNAGGEEVAFFNSPSYFYVPDASARTEIYVYMEANSVMAMDADISLRFGARTANDLEIGVAGGNDIAAMEGATIALPKAEVRTADSGGLVHNIEFNAVLSDTHKIELVEGNKLKLNKFGEYTVTYSPIDDRLADKVGTAALNVVAARKIFADGQPSLENKKFEVTDELVPAARQTVICHDTGYADARFAGVASKVYYAEATYIGKKFFLPDVSADIGIGMGHFAADDITRVLTSFVMNGTNDHKVRDLDTTVKPWTFDESVDANRVYYSWRLKEYRGLDIGVTGSSDRIKYAVARINDDFFAFVNDMYVCCVSPEFYREIDTVPGLFGAKMDQLSQITEIEFIDGDSAKQKVNLLLKGGSGVASAYVPNEYYNSPGDSLVVNQATSARGANFDFKAADNNKKDFNSSCVSPYVYFDGDFTIEWEYRPTWSSHNFGDIGNTGSLFELRSRNYWTELNKFGVRFFQNEGTDYMQFIAHRPQEGDFNYANESNKYAKDSTEYTNLFTYGAKFRVSRTITDGKATIKYTVIPFIDENKTQGQALFEVMQANIDESNFGKNYQIATETLQFVWHNMETAGEYSNIRWTHSA